MERKVSVKLPFELIILKKEREPWMSMVQSCGSFHRRQLRHSHIRAYRQTSNTTLPTAPPPQPPRAGMAYGRPPDLASNRATAHRLRCLQPQSG